MPRRDAAARFPRTLAGASIHLRDQQPVRFIPWNRFRAIAVYTRRWHSSAGGPPLGTADADLPDCVVRRGNAGGRHGAFRGTAGVGRELFAPTREVRVSRNDDEKDLDRRNFLKCMAWVGTGAV